MEVKLEQLGRRFGRDWIFRNIDCTINDGSHTIIVGGNGSGKSTLLQLISGFLSPSEGSLLFSKQGNTVEEKALFKEVSIAAPYLDVFEDLTLDEMINFQDQFRPWIGSLTSQDIVKELELEAHSHKQVKHFSSGMRQRLKLGLAILTDSSMVCLDEPSSNLDKAAVTWYRNLLTKYASNRTVFISTNHVEEEYIRKDLVIAVTDFK
ncbi:MAG: ATP-binding cassette domain-containing protein [Flavobacteriales bacterium]|nr:ATP-binding cassette domain-containing protein [Flavobacteriales bacterium]MDG2247183.1 ATP-binding cassette domain-containing protein [Flavobacteriales bacterium]